MRGRALTAGLVGTLMLASAGAHGVLGWPVLRAELAATTAPPDLVRGLALGWWFGSVAMAAFALIVLHGAWLGWRGQSSSAVPALVIGVAYVAFGAAAITLAGVSAPMMSFVVLGVVLVALSAWRP